VWQFVGVSGGRSHPTGEEKGGDGMTWKLAFGVSGGESHPTGKEKSGGRMTWMLAF